MLPDVLRLLIATLLYPGLATALVAGALYGRIVADRVGVPPLGSVRTREGAAALGSVLLASLALACLPWPLHPAAPASAWLWAWAGFELAALLPLLPALAAGPPAIVRAAIREAQLGALGRAVIWAALATALTAHADWRVATAPAHLLALATALLALPAAIGWGPFGPEGRVSPNGTQAGLPPALAALDTWARDVRSGALIAAIAVAGLPVAVGPAWLGGPIAVAGLLVILFALRRLAGSIPRFSLPAGLRLCALWGLPGASLAALALALAGLL